jgi:bifunctional UDP-N-acetylglucosamine pyrophosphorylase / glucosamine-1-phosphate N-acetyltransferase
MIIPAAGRGTRLGSPLPKVVVPVNGRAMIDYLFDLYRDLVNRFVVVVAPDAVSTVRTHCMSMGFPVELLVQAEPTGMLDAILLPRHSAAVETAEEIWITWCDQIAVSRQTAQRLAAAMAEPPRPGFVLPTMTSPHPYIHLERDSEGHVVRVLERREGDRMPARGESDIGLFALSAATYREELPRYAETAPVAAATGERNFLPFLPWLGNRVLVRTFPARNAVEAIGINTPEDLARVAAYLVGTEA